MWGIDDRAYAENLGFLKELLDLEEIWTVFARELSLGQRMRANLALTFLHDPQLVLLDEPTLGLDVLAKRQMIGFIKRINEEKKATILVTSHDMDDLMEMTRRVILIQRGKLAFDGDLQALLFRTGDRRTLRITRPGPAPELPGAKLVSSAQGVHAYEFIGTETSAVEMLARVSALAEVQDVELGRAPIESVIAALYEKWKREQPA